jgi:hypothetical protein
MLIPLLVILLVLSVLWGSAGAPRYWPASGYRGAWTPLVLLIVLVVILLLVAPNTVFGEPLPASSYAVASLLFGSVLLTANVTEPEQDPDAPPGLPFWLSWWIGNVLSAVLLAIAGLQGAFAAGNGTALGMDTRAIVLLGIAGSVLGFLRGLFPNSQHSPGNRNKLLSRVLRGQFPRDATVVEPSKAPLDTL